ALLFTITETPPESSTVPLNDGVLKTEAVVDKEPEIKSQGFQDVNYDGCVPCTHKILPHFHSKETANFQLDEATGMFIPVKDTTVYMSKEDCVDTFQEESCSKTVIVQGVLKKEFGSRIYDKILACLYCRKLLKHRIVEHLNSKYNDQLEVVQALVKIGKERTWAIEKLKHKGKYVHNIGILQSKQGELVVARRSNTNQKYDDYLPCIHCLGFFKKGELWKHCSVCKFKSKDATSNESSTQARSRMLLSSTVETESCANFKKLHPILDTMHRDEVFRFLKNDNLILTFGNILLQKLGIRRKHNNSQRMCQLARIKMNMQTKNQQLTDMWQAV
ncbi:hypothetical protein ACJMK2_038880, partial [Sinanodonta woodiana]